MFEHSITQSIRDKDLVSVWYSGSLSLNLPVIGTALLIKFLKKYNSHRCAYSTPAQFFEVKFFHNLVRLKQYNNAYD